MIRRIIAIAWFTIADLMAIRAAYSRTRDQYRAFMSLAGRLRTMTSISFSEFRKIPFFDAANLQGRALSSLTFFVRGEWHMWVSADALLELLHPHLELVLVEVLVAVVDALELASVHGDDAVGK